MADNLKEYLEERPFQSVQAGPSYFANGDFITCFFRRERCYAWRVDDSLTVYLAMGTNEVVGCKIERVRHNLRAAQESGG